MGQGEKVRAGHVESKAASKNRKRKLNKQLKKDVSVSRGKKIWRRKSKGRRRNWKT